MRAKAGTVGVALLLALLLAGCGSSGGNGNGNGNGNGDPAVLTTITVTPAMSTVAVGGTVDFTATGRDQLGAFIAMTPTWIVEGGIGALGAPAAPNEYTSTVRFTATAAATGVVRASFAGVQGEATVTVIEPNGGEGLTNLFFLHHSVGLGIVDEGGVRAHINNHNATHGTSFAFWDHGYNWEGLRDPAGVWLGTNYDIPGEDTEPAGLHNLWTTNNPARAAILANHEVIAFKSCFPASAISDAWRLADYQRWYREMRDFFDTRPDRLFVVMSPPPLHRLSTNTTEADNARAFANWLKSADYLAGHPNVVCFDLFDLLARPSDGSATRNMLRFEYEVSHGDGDSHPNMLANQAVGPAFAQFLIDAALNY